MGNYDGDGTQELAVLHQTAQGYIFRGGLKFYLACVTLSLVQWTSPGINPPSWQKVWTNDQPNCSNVLPVTNTWSDDPNATSYWDMHLTAGLFKFAPELGYNLNRRQLAVAWTPELSVQSGVMVNLQLELWDLSSPASPGANPPKTWTLNRYSSYTRPLCLSLGHTQSYAPFALEAGNWAGVKANPASPLWGVGLGYQNTANDGTLTIVEARIFRVDQNVDLNTANGPLNPAGFGWLGSHGNDSAMSPDVWLSNWASVMRAAAPGSLKRSSGR